MNKFSGARLVVALVLGVSVSHARGVNSKDSGAEVGSQLPPVLNEPFASQFTPREIRRSLEAVINRYQSEAGRSILLSEGLRAARGVLAEASSSRRDPEFKGVDAWRSELGQASKDLKEALIMVDLLPKVKKVNPSKSWTNPDTRLFSKYNRRFLTTSKDPVAAALVTYATGWGIPSRITNMTTDAFRLAVIKGWLKISDLVNEKGELAGDNPLQLAGAYLLAGSTVLPFSEVYTDAPAFTHSASYKKDLLYQQKILAQPPALTAENLKTKMRQVAEWQNANLFNPKGASDGPSPDRAWWRGVFYAGMIPAFKATGDSYYRDMAAALTARTEALPGPQAKVSPDCLAISQTYIDLYFLSKDASLYHATKKVADEILAHPHLKTPGAQYVDLLFMGAPVWGGLTKVTGDPRYAEYGYTMWKKLRRKYFDEELNLMVRDKTWLTQENGLRLRERNGRPVIWGRGMGWAIGGLAKYLDSLPEDSPYRAELGKDISLMADALLRAQKEDGLWRTSLLDPETYPMGEASATSLITYGLLWGVSEGILEKEKFFPATEKAVRGLMALIEKNGKLSYVQPGAESPRVGMYRRTNLEYAAGAVLLSFSKMLELMGQKECTD